MGKGGAMALPPLRAPWDFDGLKLRPVSSGKAGKKGKAKREKGRKSHVVQRRFRWGSDVHAFALKRSTPWGTGADYGGQAPLARPPSCPRPSPQRHRTRRFDSKPAALRERNQDKRKPADRAFPFVSPTVTHLPFL